MASQTQLPAVVALHCLQYSFLNILASPVDLLDDIALLYMTEHPSALRGARSGFRLYVTEKLINGSGIASVQIGSRALLEQLAGNDSVASLLQVQTQLVPECLVFLRKLKPLLGIEDYLTCERVLSELTTGDTQHALCQARKFDRLSKLLHGAGLRGWMDGNNGDASSDG